MRKLYKLSKKHFFFGDEKFLDEKPTDTFTCRFLNQHIIYNNVTEKENTYLVTCTQILSDIDPLLLRCFPALQEVPPSPSLI